MTQSECVEGYSSGIHTVFSACARDCERLLFTALKNLSSAFRNPRSPFRREATRPRLYRLSISLSACKQSFVAVGARVPVVQGSQTLRIPSESFQEDVNSETEASCLWPSIIEEAMVVVGVKTMIRLAARAGGTSLRLLGLKRRFQSENTMAQGAFVWETFASCSLRGTGVQEDGPR